jgi:hypothetical protein
MSEAAGEVGAAIAGFTSDSVVAAAIAATMGITRPFALLVDIILLPFCRIGPRSPSDARDRPVNDVDVFGTSADSLGSRTIGKGWRGAISYLMCKGYFLSSWAADSTE